MATTGNTTLMDVAETPRELVLAWLTGVTADVDVSAAPATPPPPPEGASRSHATRKTTMATTTRTVRTCMARGRRRNRRQERPSTATGLDAAAQRTLAADDPVCVFASINSLLCCRTRRPPDPRRPGPTP